MTSRAASSTSDALTPFLTARKAAACAAETRYHISSLSGRILDSFIAIVYHHRVRLSFRVRIHAHSCQVGPISVQRTHYVEQGQVFLSKFPIITTFRNRSVLCRQLYETGVRYLEGGIYLQTAPILEDVSIRHLRALSE